ncbi:MAG: DUF721 domain-containing protein [Legionellaceae bacterium]|nr:DUF721 domain-containing protein [Legionellaceae bacterium]
MRHITQCFNPKLTQICLQATQLKKISAIVFDYMPENLHNHCRVASFQNGCLLLTTNDAVWASQLRYIIPELRDKLRSEAKLYQLASIKISVDIEQEERNTLQAPPKKQIKPSPWRDILKHLRT